MFQADRYRGVNSSKAGESLVSLWSQKKVTVVNYQRGECDMRWFTEEGQNQNSEGTQRHVNHSVLWESFEDTMNNTTDITLV